MATEAPGQQAEAPLTDEDETFVSAVIGLRDREMRDFSAPSGSFEDGAGPREYRFATAAVSVADVIELILELIPARPQAAYEKVAWILEFEFRGIPCRLLWGKSGLRLFLWVDGDAVDSDAIGKEIERRLTGAASSLYRRAIYSRVQRKLQENRATVINQFARYRGAVDYHVGHLVQIRRDGPRVPQSGEGEPVVAALEALFRGVMADKRHQRELAYVCTAIIATYFAWVQHALVILAAFSPTSLKPHFSLQTLLDAAWADQFDAAFPPPHEAHMSRAKKDLKYLASNYRGRLLHGGGGHPSDGVVVE